MTALSRKTAVFAGVLVGVIFGFCMAVFLLNIKNEWTASDANDEILYWVAPMDANYRRAGPGKSPMGMDLVPVYINAAGQQRAEAGSVLISPQVIHNLGVRTAKVRRGRMTSSIRTVGYVQYDEDRLLHVHPRVEGWIEQLNVKSSGEPVTQGQPLYRLYSPELVSAQEELVLALRRNSPRLVDAAKDRLRALQLNEGFIKRLVDTRKVLQEVTFYAPQSGVVDILNVREGFFVKPGNKIMSIGSLDEVWIEAEVFERQAAFVEVGQEVSIRLDYIPTREWRSKIDYIYPSLNPHTRTLRLRLRIENKEQALKPNMFATVDISAASHHQQLMIPREALIRTGKQDRVVMALGEGAFKSVAVESGRINTQSVEIMSGLEEGDSVVVSAQFLLDSESSKTSDFRRMDATQSLWLDAELMSVAEDHASLMIAHGAIEQWNMPAMTMSFPLADGVSVSGLKNKEQIEVLVERKKDGSFLIRDTRARPQTPATNNSAEDLKPQIQAAENKRHAESLDTEKKSQDPPPKRHQHHADHMTVESSSEAQE